MLVMRIRRAGATCALDYLFGVARVARPALWAAAPAATLFGLAALWGRAEAWAAAGRRPGLAERTCALVLLAGVLGLLRAGFHSATVHLDQLLAVATPGLVGTTFVLLGDPSGCAPRTSGLRRGLGLALALLAGSGMVWTVARAVGLPGVEETTRQGVIVVPNDLGTSHLGPEVGALRFLTAHTRPGDSVAVLGDEPGLLFLADLRTPIRQDGFLRLFRLTRADVADVNRRLHARPPRLLIVPGNELVRPGRLSGILAYLHHDYRAVARFGEGPNEIVVLGPRPQ